MKKQLLLILLLILQSLAVFISPVIATDPAIILIEDSNDYTAYGFNDLGIYYTPESLTSFHMPFIVERTGAFNNLEKYDLDGNYTKKTGSFDKRFISHDFNILAETDGYYVIDFSMKTVVSNESFSVDFIPEIKDIEFPEFAWWNSSWTYYSTITVDHNHIDTDLVNFPLLVVVNYTIGAKCDDGDSIRFIGTNNVAEFYYEIESWNNTDDSFVWVNVTNISSSADTIFNMYYNNTGASDNQNRTNVWDSNFTGVWHMHNMSDSSSPYHNGTWHGADNITGSIDGAHDFVKANSDYTDYGDIGSNVYTLQIWFKPDETLSKTSAVGTVATLDVSRSRSVMFGPATGLLTDEVFWIMDVVDNRTGICGDYIISNTSYHLASISWNATALKYDMFLNGTEYTTTSGTATGNVTLIDADDFELARDTIPNYMDVIIDDVRFSNISRNASWIKASFHSMNQTLGFLTWGGEQSQDLGAPTNFIATVINITTINISWTKGTNATHTHIQRKTGSYPTSRSDGTHVYNDTGTYYVNTGLTSYVCHYYSAWSYNSTTGNWSGSAISYNNTGPTNPTSATGTIVGNDLNISWAMGSYADKTCIQRKTNSYPTSPTDGTNIYNGTGLYHVDATVLQTYYYTLFSWDNDTNLHSSGVNLEWGALIVSCYDEETNGSLYFDVFIFNQDGSQTYESKNNSNPLFIDIADNLPLGDKIGIQINPAQNYSEKSETFTYPITENSTITYVILAQVPEGKSTTNVTCTNTTGGTSTYPAFTLDADFITILAGATDEFDKITVNYTHDEYESRMYYRDLEANQLSILDAYLPNADDKELYKLIVLNQFDSPVEEAYVQIKRPVGGTYLVISSLYTDASGRIDIYLIPEEHYKIIISKSGYDTATSDFTPPQIIYAEDRTHIFRLNFEVPPEEPEINIWDIITFDAYFLENDNNTLYVTYHDSSGNSIQVQIRIYQNGTDLLYNNTFPDNNDFTIEWTEANHTLYDYLVRLDIYNHSDLDDQSSNIMLPKAIPSKQKFMFDLGFNLGVILGDLGEHPIGWVNCVVFFFGIFIIVTFGKYWAGLALIALGLLLGLFEIIIGLPGFTGSQIAAIAFMILFGFFVEVAKYKKTVRL